VCGSKVNKMYIYGTMESFAIFPLVALQPWVGNQPYSSKVRETLKKALRPYVRGAII
jgi:hypothetical protein